MHFVQVQVYILENIFFCSQNLKRPSSLQRQRHDELQEKRHQEDPSHDRRSDGFETEQVILPDLLHRIEHLFRVDLAHGVTAVPQRDDGGGFAKDDAPAGKHILERGRDHQARHGQRLIV